jgi:hypothetical protein
LKWPLVGEKTARGSLDDLQFFTALLLACERRTKKKLFCGNPDFRAKQNFMAKP